MILDGTAVLEAPAGSKVRVVVEKAISPGDRVFRVRNSELAKRAEETYHNSSGAVQELVAHVELRLGKPLEITLSDARGLQAGAKGPVVEAARTKPVTSEDVEEHVGRLGGTPYVISRWEIELDESVGIGFSTLHKVRREAVAAYERAVLAPWEGRTRTNPTLTARGVSARRCDKVRIVVVVDSIESARRCLSAGADEVCAPIDVLAGDDSGLPITPVLPRICKDDEFTRALGFVRAGERTVAGTLGLLDSAAVAGAVVSAEWSLNVTNSATADALAAVGASDGWLSPELSGRQIAQVCAGTDLPLGLTVSGLQEVMVTEHCVLMSLGPCNQDCLRCKRRTATHSLKDRKGYKFPIRTDLSGRTHIYNSVPLDLLPAMAEVLDAGVQAIRVDTTFLKPHQALDALERARLALSSAQTGIEPVLKPVDGPTTSGHFYRGVL